MDAIESGIVKLPRVPVTDNLVGTETVVYRDLWKHLGKSIAEVGRERKQAQPLRPLSAAAYGPLRFSIQPLCG